MLDTQSAISTPLTTSRVSARVNDLHHDAGDKARSFVLTRGDSFAPLRTFEPVIRIVDHIVNRSANSRYINLVHSNEFSAPQRRQIRCIVFSLGVSWHNHTRNARADRSQARAMTTMMDDQIRPVIR